MKLQILANLIGVIAASLAAAFWLYSIAINAPSNIEAMVYTLQRLAFWNSCAAVASCVSGLAACFSLVLSVLDHR